MIAKTLSFRKVGDGEGSGHSKLLSLDQARELLAICLRFESYVFLKAGEITIENYTLPACTDFLGPADEIAQLGSGLIERLPPAHSHSYWLEHLREQIACRESGIV